MSDVQTASGGPLRQICFMIMPYGRKPTDVEPGKGPATVDFDALWEKVFRPVIEQDLHCVPVRADQDLGALIIVEMIEKLALSDLVIADVTTPNANVYYEVGVRHAARERGCVLISASWSRQKFDLDQMRQLRYPLPEGDVTDETAAAARAALRDRIAGAMDGISPVFQALPGFPTPDPARARSLQAYVDAISAFNADVRAARLQSGAGAAGAARALWDRYRNNVGRMPAVALEVLYLLRDARDWQGVVELVDGLPESVRRVSVVREQYWLARSKLGDHAQAVAALEELIRATGDSSERRGLIGGRYKKLYDAAAPGSPERTRFLAQAIEQYERGMLLDLNDYYPSSNLPRLLRLRGRLGDEDRARAAAAVTMLACRRAIARNPADEWVRPTLLGAAFDAGDVTEATRLYDEMVENGIAAFHVETTLADLERTVAGMAEGETRTALATLLDDLRALLPAAAPAPAGV
jgi:pentatricopeptide repeat protein